MNLSRRDMRALLPLLAARALGADSAASVPSEALPFDRLLVRTDPKSHAEFRQVFNGTTHEGFPIDLHITTMPPGQMPHPSHHHTHEEMMLIQKGSLEVTISGKTSVVGPGSVIFVHSNEEHGFKCAGDVTAQYFVLALGKLTE